jgi:hypothetical protein
MPEWEFSVSFSSPAFLGSVQQGTKAVTYFKKDKRTKQFVQLHERKPYFPVDDGVRVPSLRGILAFWYRAGLEQKSDVFEAQERAWGSADGGQGLRLRPTQMPTLPKPEAFQRVNPGFLYIGYGPLQPVEVPDRTGHRKVVSSYNEQHARDYIAADSAHRFAFAARGRPDQITALKRAATLLLLFGGMGSRSRRGWGSVHVAGEDIPPPPENVGSVARWIQAALSELGIRFQQPNDAESPPVDPNGPPFSQLSPGTSIRLLTNGSSGWDNPEEVLLEFSRRFRELRSYQDKRPLAVSDHDREFADWENRTMTYVPRRLAFGMPYQPGRSWWKGDSKPWKMAYQGRDSKGDEVNRRASPLILKVLRLANGKHVGIALFLRASFFGDPGTVIEAEGKKGTSVFPGYSAIDELFRQPGWTTVTLP